MLFQTPSSPIQATVTLTKSDYILWCDCPQNAWLKRHDYPRYLDLSGGGLSDFERSLSETGTLVEEHARLRYPGGTLITTREQAAVWSTAQAIARGDHVIYQASFTNGPLFAAVDILLHDPTTGAFTVLEVKASTEKVQPKKDKSRFLENIYVQDLGFQVHLLKSLGHTIARAAIVRLNGDYVRGDDLDLDQLFIEDDLTEFLVEADPIIDERIRTAFAFMTQTEAPSGPCRCIHRGRSKHCTSFAHFNPDYAGYGIHDVTYIGAHPTTLRNLVASGYRTLHDVPEDFDWPRDSQRLQATVTRSNTPHVDHDGIAQALSNLVYPLYYLDYETYAPAIPRFAGYRPFQHMPFQYSLHIEREPGAPLDHVDFLSFDPRDPAPYLFASLQKAIGPTGSIVVWSAAMERSNVNAKQAERLPQFRPFLEDLNRRMFDLLDVFAKQLHVHPDYLGKTSIKKVLPALVGWSYADLDVGNGGEAMNAWNRVVTSENPTEQAQQIRQHMLDYCALDTKAMWGILDQLRHL